MKVLFVTPHPPSEVRVRPYLFARALQAAGHQVTVASPISSPAEAADLDALAAQGFRTVSRPLSGTERVRHVLSAKLRGEPMQAYICWSPDLAQDLLKEAGAYDVVHAEHLRGARYGLALSAHAPVLWDAVDSISALFEAALQRSTSPKGKWFARSDLAATRRYEASLPARFDVTIATSAQDATSLGAGGAVVRVIPNPVDLARFPATTGERDPDTVIMTGKMSYHANVTAARWLVESVMPLVWLERPGVRVRIVGAQPDESVRKLADDGRGLVDVTGNVPSVAHELARASVAVAPIVYGAGIQNKVLEAMATATPVVATSIAASGVMGAGSFGAGGASGVMGAASGVMGAASEGNGAESGAMGAERGVMGAESGVMGAPSEGNGGSGSPAPDADPANSCGLVVADRPEAFAQAILDLLADPDRAQRLGAAGRRHVERAHRPEAAARALEEAYRDAIDIGRKRLDSGGTAQATFPV